MKGHMKQTWVLCVPLLTIEGVQIFENLRQKNPVNCESIIELRITS